MISWQITNTLAAILLPPGLLIILMACGLKLLRACPRLGYSMLATGLLALYGLALPVTAHFLLSRWESAVTAVAGNAAAAQAIVVLGGGKYYRAPEYGGDTVLASTLVRLRYAARLHRQTGLPLLVSGGSPEGSAESEAEVMRRTLEQEFAVPVKWSEAQSANTLGNARLSYQILANEGLRTIYLVTHAWHMPRAQLVFERAGFRVIPAPTAFTTRYRLTVLDFLPNAQALRDSALFFHEVIGTVWYRVRLLLD